MTFEEFIERHRVRIDYGPHPKGCVLWIGARSDDGYGHASIDGVLTKVHRFALAAHLGRPLKKGMCSLHTCDTPACFLAEHLYEGTKKNNAHDREVRNRANHARGKNHGCATHPGLRRGERNGRAKLTVGKVREIRKRAAAGERKVDLAREFSFTPEGIHSIVSMKTWRHVEG